MSTKCIIAGSRGAPFKAVLEAVNACPFWPEVVTVVSGGVRGADQHGETIAKQQGKRLSRFPADWEKYGKKAGYLRNSQMADYADCLIAVWDGKSRGTKHMIKEAEKKNLDTYIFYYRSFY